MSQVFRCELYNKRQRIRQFDSDADDLSQLNFNVGCLVGHFTNNSVFNDEDLCVTIRLINKL